MILKGKAGDEIYLPKIETFIKFNAKGFFETNDEKIIEALPVNDEEKIEALPVNNEKKNKVKINKK